MGSLPKTLPADFFDSRDDLPKSLPANFFDNSEQQPPIVPTIAAPKSSPGPISPPQALTKSSPGPSMQQMDWVREQARRTPPPPPPTVAAAQAPLRQPAPIPPSPLRPPESAVQPEAPGKIEPTVVTSPTGQLAAPIPGRIPGMERLGGKAPGVPRPSLPQVGQPPVARPPMEEYMGPRSDEYVIADDPTIPAFVRGASGATLGSVGGVLKSIGESRSGSARPLASGPNFAGLPGSAEQTPAGSVMQRMGDAALAADESVQATFARDASIKNFMDDPGGAMSDPRWWMDSTFSAAGSMLPMLATGVGTGAGISRVAASRLIAPEVGQAAVQYGPSVAAALTEATQVYGNTYGEARKAGLDPELAREAAALVASVTGLTSIPAHKVGIFNDQIRSIGRRLAAGSMAEGGQEGVQTWWENVVAKNFYDPNRPLLQGVPEAVVGAGIVGAATGTQGINEQATPEVRNPEAAASAERERARGTVSMPTPAAMAQARAAQSPVPAPPPGFEIDVPPPAPRIDPADAPAIVPPQAEVAPLPPPPSIPEVEDQPAADSAIEYNDIEENQAPLPAGGEPQISPIEVPAQVRDVKPVNGIYDYSGSTDAEIESSVRSRFRNSILSEEEILGQVELEKRLRDYSKQSAMEVIEAEKEWEWTKPLGDLPVVSAKDLGSKQWLHGTSPEGKLAIANSGKFEPSKGKRFYDYSQFGPDTTYLTTEDSFWFQDPDGARAVRYPNQISVSLSPEARVALIRNESDTKALANKLGFESWNSLERILTVDGLKDTPTEQSLQRLRSSRDLVSRLTSEGIDAIYIYPHDAFDGPASQQLAVFNNNVIKPNLSQVPAPGPRKEVVQPETVDAAAPVAEGEPDIQQPAPAPQQAPPVDPGPVDEAVPTIDRFHAAYQKLTGDNYGQAVTLSDVQKEMAITDPAEFTRMLADIDRGPGITSDGAKLALPASTGTKGNNVYRDGDTSYYGIRFDRDTSPANPGPVKQVAAQNFNLEGPLQKEAVKAERPLNTPPDPGPVDTGVTWQDKGKLRIRTEDLAVDPIRFQYKVEGIGQGGVTSELKEVEGWDDDAAGTIFVWKDPKDGKTYVVNGHHRYDLARRLGQPDVGIKYIDAPDAQAARAAGALQNIREGKGSAIDAAKFLRDTGKTIADLKAANITVKGQVAKDGAALANLAPSLFDDVVHGNLKQDRAAIIGEGLDSYDDQKTVLKLADQKKATNAELREMIRLALAEKAEIAESREGDPVEDEYDLFGNKIGSEPRTTIYEKSQLSNYIQQRLRQEGKMFGMVGTESAAKRLASAGNEIKAEANKEISDQANQALAAYNKETLYSGPITDLLRQGAERIANGEKADAVKESVYASVRDRIAQILPKPAGQATAVREADAGPVESSDRGVQEKPRQRTVVKTKDGLQESIVSDIEARESQIAARNDRTRPLAEVPFSLVAEEAPQPTGPDERQESMFGDDNEIASYAPGVESVASKASKPSSPRPPAAHGSMVSRSAIVKDLSAILNDIPIRQGLFREPGALGIFKTRQGVIRTKKALDLPTIAHEIGHAIHKRIWGIDAKNPNKLNSGPLRKFKKELGPLDYDPQQSRPFEGFAEYIRLALTEPATAQKRAPYFHTWFQGVLAKYPEMSGTLDKIADRIQDWEQQPAPVKLAASINVTPDENSKWANFKKLIGDLDYEMVNEGVDLAKFDPAAYVLYRLSKSSFTRAHFALTNGTVSPTKDGYEKNGDSLQDIIRPIAQRNPSEYNSRFSRFAKDWKIEMANDGLNDFRMYLAAKRLQDYRKKDLETGWTDEQLKEVIDSTTTPAIIEAAEKLQSFQNRILDYVVEKGSMSAETADWIRANNEFYVPLYRVMDEGDGKGLGERKMLDITSPVRQRKGSQREIIDPLESIVRNTYAMYSFADRNEVSLILFKNTEKRQDQGYLFESGIVRPMKRTEVDLEEIKPTIIDSLEKSGIAVPKNLKFDSIAAVFKANLDPQRSRGIVRIIVDGQVELVQMAPQLIRALDSMDRSSANILIKILSVPAKGLTFGAVTGNPEFAGTNWMRDQFTAGLQSRNRYIPFVHGVYGVYKMITDKKLMQEFVLNGGASAALMPLSRENLRLSLDQLSMTKTQFIANHPTHLLSMLKDVLTYAGTKSEIATRFAEYSLARGRGKSARESVLDSKDVTLDFDRMGRTARVINKVIPFFAVSINGIGRFAEMHNPRNRSLFARAMVNGAALSAASLALWWVNKDDEEWKKQPAWLRDFFWLIPTKDLGLSLPVVGPFIPIPKPPIWGQVYGSSVERLAERLYSKNKHAFDGYGNSLLQTLTPPAQLQALRGAYEVYSNHVSFTDRPLETQAMRNRSSQYRYTEKTSEIAKKVSNDFNYIGVEFSPVQVEHLMYSYGAGLGKLIVNSTEELSGARANRPAMGPRDRPITRIFSTDIEPVVTENYLLFEKRLRKLEQKQGDAKFTGSASDGPTPPELSDLKKLTSLSKQFSKIRAQQHKNSASIKAGKMTREQARDANDSLARTREAILKRNKHLFE